MNEDFYAGIIVNAPFDRERLAEMIKPYAVIVDTTYDVLWQSRLSIRKRVIVQLLIQLVLSDIGVGERGLTPNQLEDLLKVKGNSVRPTLKLLVDSHVITTENGLYFVLPRQFANVEQELAHGR